MKKRLYKDPGGSGVSTFDSAVNEPIRTASWGSSLRDDHRNDGVDEGSYAEDSDDDME
jgi:hypothetical protein